MKLQGENKEKSQLESQMEVLSSFLVQLKSGINFSDRAIADGDDVELLSVKKQVTQRLAQLNASQYQCQPCQNDYLKLGVRKTIGDIGEMAVLYHIPIDPDKCVVSMVGGETGVFYETLVGQTVDFLLTLNYGEGATEIVGNYDVSVVVKYQQQGRREEESLPVCDNGDGSHSFSFHPEDVGPVTLTVMVEHQNICGSPFVWQVKNKEPGFAATGTKKMKMTSSADASVCREGLYCWKLKLVSFTGARNALEIGVQNSKRLRKGQSAGFSFGGSSYDQRGKWSWQYKFNTGLTDGYSSRSDGQKPSIVSVRDHDVFTVFLNLETKKLIIYNVRSKQSETFTDVEGELVPLYTPESSQPNTLTGRGLFSVIVTSYLTLA